MINFVKKLLKSNIFLIVLAEKLLTDLKINFEKEYKIVSYIDKPIILDVGGHKGESVANFRKFNPKSLVYSFEPNLNLYKKIKKNFLFDKKIKIYNFAISNKKKIFFLIKKLKYIILLFQIKKLITFIFLMHLINL